MLFLSGFRTVSCVPVLREGKGKEAGMIESPYFVATEVCGKRPLNFKVFVEKTETGGYNEGYRQRNPDPDRVIPALRLATT